MYSAVASYLTNRISPSYVQIRAGSSILGSGGSLHEATHIYKHEFYYYYYNDYDVAVVRVSDNVLQTLLWDKETLTAFKYAKWEGKIGLQFKARLLTAALTVRNTTNCNYYMFQRNLKIEN
jgi:hypothetical protein